MRQLFAALTIALLFTACQTDSTNQWTETDLLSSGLPITIMAPDSTNIEVSDLGVMKDVTIEGVSDPNYFVQIYASEAGNTEASQVKADQVSDVRSNPYFSQIIEEDNEGFIYETTIDSTNYYSFRYVYLQGDMEYIFTTGLAKTFGLEQVEAMYQAVKQQ